MSFVKISDTEVIIKKGTELFHATGEKYDKRNITTGGYDNVFWTTDSSAIAQTYIPMSPSSYYLDTKTIAFPSKNPEFQKIQKMFGINYDYSKVKYVNGQISSYEPASIFKKYVDYNNKLYYKYVSYVKLSDKYKAYSEKHMYGDNIDKLSKDFFKKWNDVEENKIKYGKEYSKGLNNELIYKYVNNKLEKMGYKPTDNSYDFNYQWELNFNNGNLENGNYRTKGRLLIVKPNRDLKMYDTTNGGKREADLTDLDYHKHNWFEMAEKNGYDGIVITDFAQSNDYGNINHISYGLFENTLKNVSVTEIDAQHNDLDKHFKNNDWNSPEYRKMNKIVNEEILKLLTLI